MFPEIKQLSLFNFLCLYLAKENFLSLHGVEDKSLSYILIIQQHSAKGQHSPEKLDERHMIRQYWGNEPGNHHGNEGSLFPKCSRGKKKAVAQMLALEMWSIIENTSSHLHCTKAPFIWRTRFNFQLWTFTSTSPHLFATLFQWMEDY